VPEIEFRYDKGIEATDRVARLLQADPRSAGAAAGGGPGGGPGAGESPALDEEEDDPEDEPR
jgi:hypothetical protein